MLDERIRERAKQLIIVQFAEREEQLKKDLGLAKADFSRDGIYHSSMMLRKLQEIIVRELEIRTMLAWESIVRVHRTLGSEVISNLKVDLQKELFKYIDQEDDALSRLLEEERLRVDKGASLSLTEAVKHVKAKHEIEIELYVDSLEQAKQVSQPPAPVYHFYGNVGAVQTGLYASANIIQNLGEADKEFLFNALSMIKDTLASIREMSETQRKELTQMVEETLTEIKSAQPNNTKVKAILNTLAISIQTVASAQPAYQALKSALLPLGITLP
jgi:hypothetical protein